MSPHSTPPHVGLLPFYLELYDRVLPDLRGRLEDFYRQVADALRCRGVTVETTTPCRIETEFHAAVRQFEAAKVDAIVTLHLAYSPSLESAATLAATALPLIVLDTTPDAAFGPERDFNALLMNHGIHGAQDMCNLLIRHRKPFVIEAGHWMESDVLDRVARHARGARMVRALRAARVGRIGEPFKGMGDFLVEPSDLQCALGVQTVSARPDSFGQFLKDLDPRAVADEMDADRERFQLVHVTTETHRRSVEAGLAVRRWIEHEKLTAFTFNFLALDRQSGFPTVPFLEASKALASGIGYAGEGDVLTAALVGALGQVYRQTTFTEMFCPDWRGQRIFFSHMGEMNAALGAGRLELREKPFAFGDIPAPAVAVGCYQSGAAILVNLAPISKTTFRLILIPGDMAAVGDATGLADSIRGWFMPHVPVEPMLARYGRSGGTHHLALVYGAEMETLVSFAALAGLEHVMIA